MTDITEIIDRLEPLAKEATPGPWDAFHYARGSGTYDVHVRGDLKNTVVAWPGFDSSDKSKAKKRANSRYIAAANPAAILAIIAALREQAAELAELREYKRKCEEQEPELWAFPDMTWTPIKAMGVDHKGWPHYALPKPAPVSVPEALRKAMSQIEDEAATLRSDAHHIFTRMRTAVQAHFNAAPQPKENSR